MSNQFPESSKINRQKAIEEGRKTYDGVACKKCGSTLKHVSSYSCVDCNTKRNLHKLYDDDLMAPYRTAEKRKIWENKNPEKVKSIDNKYNSSEKGRITNNNKAAKRRARVRNQLPSDADFDIIKKIYSECRRISQETGIPHEVDHIIPIAEGGLHHQDNLQIITMSENRKKGSKLL